MVFDLQYRTAAARVGYAWLQTEGRFLASEKIIIYFEVERLEEDLILLIRSL